MQIEGIRKIGSRMSSLVTGSILDIFTLQGFEECCRINKRCKVVDKCNFLSFLKSSVIFSNRHLDLTCSISSHSVG